MTEGGPAPIEVDDQEIYIYAFKGSDGSIAYRRGNLIQAIGYLELLNTHESQGCLDGRPWTVEMIEPYAGGTRHVTGMGLHVHPKTGKIREW